MIINFKLYIKCILNNQRYSFVNNLVSREKNDNIIISTKSLYFLMIHFRFSSLFYSSQLVDIFSYEVLNSINSKKMANNSNLNKSMSSLVVYNMHVLNTQNRFFLFSRGLSIQNSKIVPNMSANKLSSITELYSSAN